EKDAFDRFRLQAEALAAGGVDGLLVETMTDLGEAVAAVRAAAGPGLPVVATMTFRPPAGKQFPNTGGEIDRAARELQRAGACGLGANCGTGPEPLVDTVRILRSATRLPIVVQPSCGVPRQDAGKLLVPVDPEDMARLIADFVQAGATWIGGCCGTTETHIRAMAREVGRVQLLP
ncbi:MAG: homocysteine S-methyltransferase family protein, partial [Acidobacteriota bacterium]